jgi:two-component system chemotaxis response regulator CheB
MRKIKVLVVDDSAVIRRLVSDVISADPQLEVAGCAANGEIALAMVEQLSPDVVTLDVEMPVMNGIETVKAIRAKYAKLPVIMFSNMTERGAEVTIDALSNGASDYVTKPSNAGGVALAKQCIGEALIPKIKGLCGLRLTEAHSTVPVSAPVARRGAASRRIDVVAIGCSTGGPSALAAVLSAFPEDFPVPVLIVQHMLPMFTRFLAERLRSICGLQVKEAASGDLVESGTVWLAPGGYHLKVMRDRASSAVRLFTDQSPAENSCRPSVDVLFRSLAETYSGNVLAAVLTGMGTDGLAGCESLAASNAHILAQDEASSVVWGMPGYVAKAGLCNAVLPLEQMGSQIVRCVLSSRHISMPASGAWEARTTI